jgi:hypothetical protein
VAVLFLQRHAAGEHAHHGGGDALVGDHHVAPAGEEEQRVRAGVGGAHRGDERVLRGGLHERARRASEAQRRVRRELHAGDGSRADG